jgi:hypothetical protein
MSDAPERVWHTIDRRGKISGSPDAHVRPCDEVSDAYVEYIRADLVPQWQPIENAPRDGTQILGAWQCLNKTWDMNAMFYFEEDGEGGWFDYHAEYMHNPTHWMPLPNPPPAT